MKMNIKGFWAAFFFLLSFKALAAINPIGWQLNQTFGPVVTAGRAHTIIYTFTNQLPWTLCKPIAILRNASPQIEFTFADNCTGKRLLSYETCTVSVTLTPIIDGEKFLQLTIAGYDHNQVPLPQIVTVASGETKPGVVGTVTKALPATLPAGTTADYAFQFTNYGESTATNVVLTLSQTTGTPNYTSTCGSSTFPGTLGAGATCTVSGNYTGFTPPPSLQTVTASLAFNNAHGSPATVSTSTTVSGTSADIVGSVSSLFYLPPLMLVGTEYTVHFFFTNMTNHTVPFTPSGTVSCNASAGPPCTFTQTLNSCTTSPLPAYPARCEIRGTLTPSTNGATYTLTSSLPFTGSGAPNPATATTSGTAATTLPSDRTLTFVNNCTFPVRFSLNGGALPAPFSNTNCPSPFADPDAATGLCYWHNYSANTPNNFDLAALGGTATVTIPIPTPGSPLNNTGLQWSGNMSASTGCTSPATACSYVTCGNNNSTTACTVGQGFLQPATQAEITMLINDADTYDVEVINGFHIPISMQPFIAPGVAATPNNYSCGTPGGYFGVPPAASNGFGTCDWQNPSLSAKPPSALTDKVSGYYWVTGGGSSCNINSATACTTLGQLCGLDNNFNQVCGNFLGYWSANEVCSKPGVSSTVNTYFKCTQALSPTPQSPSGGFPTGSTLYQLMACKIPAGDVNNPLFNSCYLSYPGYNSGQIATCCGCSDWSGTGANPNTSSCGTQIDPQWTSYIQPQIQWMKTACPSAYTYPFDDKTSTFTCSNNSPGLSNSVGYTITFCSGNTGLPTGATNGR